MSVRVSGKKFNQKKYNETFCHIHTDVSSSCRVLTGRMISGSKSTYRSANPDNLAVFNANLVSANHKKKIWYGDLDLTKDGHKLKEIAWLLEDTFYVLQEMDCRFDTETDKFEDLVQRAVWTTDEA